MSTVADLVVEMLATAGIPRVYGVVGTVVLPLLDALYRSKAVEYVSTRHEQVAVHMADATARLTGQPGVCLAHVGPGATNLVMGVAAAHKDCSPVIAIAGNRMTASLGRDSWQELDLVSIFRPITKWSAQAANAADVPRLLRQAMVVATSGRPGPVFLSFPQDLLTKELDDKTLPAAAQLKFLGGNPLRAPLSRPQPAPGDLARATRLLGAARRPVIFAGGGALWSGASADLQTLAEQMGAPVVETETARGVIPEDHPLCLGPVGLAGLGAALEALKAADLVLAVGAKFTDVSTAGWTAIAPEARIIHVDVDASDVARQYVPDLFILADARSTAARLRFMVPAQPAAGWADGRLAELQRRRDDERAAFRVAKPGDRVKPQEMLAAFDRVLAPNAIVTVGAGLHSRFMGQVLVREPRSFVSAAGLGPMGHAYPAALGAKLAFPERQAVALVGDGDFAMVSQDLETAVRRQIGAVAVVYNNFRYGSHHLRQERLYGGRFIGTEHGNPDFAELARLYGAAGKRAERPGEFEPALRELLALNQPGVLDVIVDPEEKPAGLA